MSNVYVVSSRSCSECGAVKAIRVLDHKPSRDEIRENEMEIGGMWCIYSLVALCKINDKPQEVKE